LRYKNRFVEIVDSNGNLKLISASKFWLENSDRREFDGVVFKPEGTSPKNYNLWRGFAVEPKKGVFSLYLDLIQDVICNNDEKIIRYLIAWMAHAVQKTEELPGVAIVLIGKQGTGKGTLCREFGALFGQHYKQVFSVRHFVGNFNAHLKDNIVLFGDECFYAGDKTIEATLKGLITEPKKPIEEKGKDLYVVGNYTRLIVASNHNWVIPAGMEERRFCVIEVSDKRMQDTKYFDMLITQMNRGGREAFLEYLLGYDISRIDIRIAPKTEALYEQKVRSLDPIHMFWLQCLKNGYILESHKKWEQIVQTSSMYEEFIKNTKNMGMRNNVNSIAFGIALHKLCPKIKKVRKTVPIANDKGYVSNKTRNCYELPTHEECVEFFEKLICFTILDSQEKNNIAMDLNEKDDPYDDVPF